MAHKFDPQNKKRLDTEKRRAIMPPEETLLKLGLKSLDIASDIGCGAGYFTLPAARIVSSGGLVYALDTSEDMLAEVVRKAAESGVSNITALRTGEYDLKLESGCIDFALICNVLHEIEDKSRFLDEIHRILRPGGRLAIIEWLKPRVDFGPSDEERIDKDQLQNLIGSSGLIYEGHFDFIESFYAMTAIKK